MFPSHDRVEGACTLSKKPEDDKYSVKDYYLHPYYAYQMWKIIFEVIFEEKKQKKSLTTTSKHVTL